MKKHHIYGLISAMAASIFSAQSSFAADILQDALWIGAPAQDLPLYPQYLTVFKIDFDVEVQPNSEASILYGINDPRLINANKNIYNISSAEDESAIKITFDPDGKISIYRYGYSPTDKKDTPIKVFDCKDAWSETNHVSIASNLGYTDIMVNGKKAGRIGLNPIGNGGDYIAFPAVGEMAVDIQGHASISHIKILNFREPSNTLFSDSGIHTTSSNISVPVRNMPLLRTRIPVDDKAVKSAKLDITCRGIYDIELNGNRITTDYFYPGSTQYNKSMVYHTFDLTPWLKSGSNLMEVQLGEGWWSGPSTYMGEKYNFFGDRQSILGKVTVEYADGSTATFPTSPSSWEYTAESPLTVGSLFNGEVYDASRSPKEWHKAVEIAADTTAYPFDGGWDKVRFLPSFGDRVTAVDTLTAVSVSEPRPGVYIYDFGQNLAGVPLIDFSESKPGTVYTMRFAEVLYPDMEAYDQNSGMIMTENIRAAMNQDTYVAAGSDTEVFSPRFTLHGFRYLELTGTPTPLDPKRVKALALSSIKDFKADFECSDSLVNRLWENILWSTRSNFISIPTDCPQRNERLGWMGDISVFAPTATKIADVSGLLRQYLQSVRDCQSDNGKFPDVAPTGVGFGGMLWGSAGITVPYQHFLQYGDTAVVREHYPAMKRYMDYLMNETTERTTGLIVQDRAWGDLGDWLSPEYNKNDKSLLWECYLIYDFDIMGRLATMLGKEDDAKYYASMAKARRDFFYAVYVDPDTKKTRFSGFDPDRKGSPVDTQASYALPIALGIVDDPVFSDNFIATITRENNDDNGKTLPPYSLMTGFIGTAWISEALSKIGREDLAYRLLTNTEYPSWLYPVTQGATTIWERLNSYTHIDGFGKNNSMNSFNHYSFGSVGNWLLSRSLGITYDDKGLYIAPQPDPTGSITYARGYLDTPYGRVKCSWSIDGDQVIYDIDTPIAAILTSPDGSNKEIPAGKYHNASRITR